MKTVILEDADWTQVVSMMASALASRDATFMKVTSQLSQQHLAQQNARAAEGNGHAVGEVEEQRSSIAQHRGDDPGGTPAGPGGGGSVPQPTPRASRK